MKNPRLKMKKRVVFKKGKYVVTRKGNVVIRLSKKIYSGLKPFCEKIKIAGSIRREEKNPVDIDIVLIPKNKQKIIDYIKIYGKYLQGGDKRVSFKINGIKAELYFTNPKSWGATPLSYSSNTGSSIGLRMFAKRKGYKLNQYGLFKDKKYIVGKTEREIYEALGKKYKSPRLR